jgi:CMP-N-acetylneuraminic acid synthetase
VLAVITARGGSKGLPRKNVLRLAGRPLIAWTVAAAIAARSVGRIVVSTDDSEIAEAARAAGAETPFLRPAELATDTAGTIDVLRHAVGECPGFDHVLLLQPTSPLRTAEDIDAAFLRLQESGAPSCVSVCEVHESPWLMYRHDADGRLRRLLPEPATGLRRQDLPSIYRLNGAIYLARTDWFIASGRLLSPDTVGFVMPTERSVDIDTLADFERAERLLVPERNV